MTAADLLCALDLPTAARVDRRIPKTLLAENGAPTTADRRRINEGIERLTWVATLKPTTVGVAAYRDEIREYVEIAVLHMILRPAAKAIRLTELLHRAVPYPVVAITEQYDRAHLSLAHKRWSHGESAKVVLDGEVAYAERDEVDAAAGAAFLSALAVNRQPRVNLYSLYQGWIDAVLALQAARHTTEFVLLASAERRASRSEALGECERLATEIARLRVAAAKEKQIRRQVELNLELKRLEAERAAAVARL